VAQGASTLSVIDGVAATAGQVVYYDGAVWRLKDADDLPFSVSAWVKMSDATNFRLLSKYGNSNSLREYLFGTNASDFLLLYIRDAAGQSPSIVSDVALTSYEQEWIHVAATYGGAGPSSGSPFSASMTGNSALYVNGQLIASTPSDKGSYAGIQNTAQAVYIGRSDAIYADGEIKEVKLFNRELSASEVVDSMNGDLGFADEWGGALGSQWISDFSAGVDSSTGVRATLAGNIDSIGSRDDNLRITINTDNNSHGAWRGATMTTGKRYRVDYDFYIPSTNIATDGIRANFSNSVSTAIAHQDDAPTLDTWVRGSGETIAQWPNIYFFTQDGGDPTYTDGAGTDVVYIRNVKVTEIGTLADLRASRFDESTGKLYDASSNAFVGTNNGSTLVGNALPVYETGSWTPSIEFGGGSTGVAYSSQSGFYTRIGNQCHISCRLTLTSKGSDTGTAVITGLPFTSDSGTNQNGSVRVVFAANLAALTSGIEGRTTESSTSVTLQDWGAAGTAVLSNANFTDTSSFRLAGTYQIQ
jgi:hypothetical protein